MGLPQVWEEKPLAVWWFLVFLLVEGVRFLGKLVWWSYLALTMLSAVFAYVHEGAHLLACKLLRVPHTFRGYDAVEESLVVEFEGSLWQASLVNIAPLLLVVPAYYSFEIFFSTGSVLRWFFFIAGLGLGSSFLPSRMDSRVVLSASPFAPLQSLFALIHLPFFILQLPSLVSSEYPHILKIVCSFVLFLIASPVPVFSITRGVLY